MSTSQNLNHPLTFTTYWGGITSIFTHPPSLLCFLVGCVFFYGINEVGKWLYLQTSLRKIKKEENDKMQNKTVSKKEEEEQMDKFANVFMSLIHCTIVVIGCVPYIIASPPTQVVPSNNSYQLSVFRTFLFKCSSNFSQAYLLVDLLIYVFKYFHMFDNRVMLFHHLFAFLATVPGSTLRYDNVPYEGVFICAACYLIEFSTIFLNLRFFAKLLRWQTLYFFSGANLIIFYPLLRNGWLGYVIYFTHSSTIDFTYCIGMKEIAYLAEFFVFFMSLGYYVILLKAGKNLFFLKIPTTSAIAGDTNLSNQVHKQKHDKKKKGVEPVQHSKLDANASTTNKKLTKEN